MHDIRGPSPDCRNAELSGPLGAAAAAGGTGAPPCCRCRMVCDTSSHVLMMTADEVHLVASGFSRRSRSYWCTHDMKKPRFTAITRRSSILVPQSSLTLPGLDQCAPLERTTSGRRLHFLCWSIIIFPAIFPYLF